MPGNLFDQIFTSCQYSCLWSAQKFISTKRYNICTFLQKLLYGLFRLDSIKGNVHKAPTSKVHQKGNSAVMCRFCKLYKLCFMGKTGNLIVAGVHFQKGSGILCHCIFVILQISPVGSPHFHKHRSTLAAYIRNPELPANLHKLSSGNYGFPSGGQRCQHEQHCCRVVIHCNGSLSPCQLAEIFSKMIISASPLPIFQIQFQIGISGHQRYKLRHKSVPQRRSSQICVEDHTGSIDHPLHLPLASVRKQSLHFLQNILCII